MALKKDEHFESQTLEIADWDKFNGNLQIKVVWLPEITYHIWNWITKVKKIGFIFLSLWRYVWGLKATSTVLTTDKQKSWIIYRFSIHMNLWRNRFLNRSDSSIGENMEAGKPKSSMSSLSWKSNLNLKFLIKQKFCQEKMSDDVCSEGQKKSRLKQLYLTH